MDAITDRLRAGWGLDTVTIEPLPAGHTNSSYRVHSGDIVRVLRCSWPGKTIAQVQREDHVLHLVHGRLADIQTPCLQRTLHDTTGSHASDGTWLHLFQCIGGTPGLPENATPATRHAMHALACLHRELARDTAGRYGPVDWLAARYERVRSRPPPPLPDGLDVDYVPLTQHIGQCVAAAKTWIRGPVQWLHGDYHAGNLLFVEDQVSGVVDFDEVGHGSAWLELAFAAFAFARDASIEHRFHASRWRWETAVHAYATTCRTTDVAWLLARHAALLTLFCADQLLIHIEAAQRGLWRLTPGIGFLGCWHELNAQRVAATSPRSSA